MSYPFRIATSIEVPPAPANDGTEETVNVRMYSVLLQLFVRKAKEPVFPLFRQKAA
jgi:hypothetical protein